MNEHELRAAYDAASSAVDEDGFWRSAALLESVFLDDRDAALALTGLLNWAGADQARRLDLAQQVFGKWHQDPEVLVKLGVVSEGFRDYRYLNAAAPEHPVFADLVSALTTRMRSDDDQLQREVCGALAVAARSGGRRYDAIGEEAMVAAIALDPENGSFHYDLGLFYKTRGRFDEGLAANERALELGGSDNDSVLWNLGICATGAGKGARALQIWRGMRLTMSLGSDGLPSGIFDSVQVRLAERPLAERSASDDDPGLEETIWVERLSPCHGMVQSALFQDFGLDWGDVVLFDGAAIDVRDLEGRKVPVFPHVSTIRKGGWNVFRFAGTQDSSAQIVDLRLPGGVVVYVHAEQSTNDGQQIATGKIVAPPTVDVRAIADALDQSLKTLPVKIAIPDLFRARGEDERAGQEQSRFDQLTRN